MLDVSLYCIGKTAHLSMPVTGFLMLQEQKKLRLKWEIDIENRRAYPYLTLLGVDVAGKRIILDFEDGYDMPPGELEQAVRRSDYYFRRTFSETKNAVLPASLQRRMYPLGFHYHVSWPGNFMDGIWERGDWKEEVFQMLFNGAPRCYFTPEKFEALPQKSADTSILFYTRLWNSCEESVVRLNKERIDLMRIVKKHYGRWFIGGIQFSPFAMKMCRDLVVGVAQTRRRRYLHTLHQADICIGTIGLHRSVGWKTAEYISASKAIVNERIPYEVPGDFQNGQNYLAFAGIDECCTQIENLLCHPQRVYEMKCANADYYQKYLRPDRLIANMLDKVFPGFLE